MEEQADRVRLIALFQQMETGCRSGDVGCEAGASAGKAYTLKPQYGFIYVIEAPWGRAANGRAPPDYGRCLRIRAWTRKSCSHT